MPSAALAAERQLLLRSQVGPEIPQQQPSQRDYRTDKREPIAVVGVERRGLFQSIPTLQRDTLIAWRLGNNAAVGIDDRSHPGVGVAQQPAVVLCRAHSRHVEML